MSKDNLQNDPKSDLRFFIQELQQFKKQRQLFQIQLKAEIHHIKGRLKFLMDGVKSKNSAPYPSCWIIYRKIN